MTAKKQKRNLAELDRLHTGTTVAAALTITSFGNKEHYQPEKDMLAPPARRGADDGLQVPSRVGNRLYYRDGRVEQI